MKKIDQMKMPPNPPMKFELSEMEIMQIGEIMYREVKAGNIHMREITNLLYICLRFYRDKNNL